MQETALDSLFTIHSCTLLYCRPKNETETFQKNSLKSAQSSTFNQSKTDNQFIQEPRKSTI